MQSNLITPNPILQMSGSSEQHNRFLNLSLIVVAIVLIVGILYWWSVSGNNLKKVSTEDDVRAQVAAILRSAPTQVSQDQINQVASQLSASKVAVTDAQKEAVAKALMNK